MLGGIDSYQRLGGHSAKRRNPRPVRLCFNTLKEKHEFLSIAKDLRKLGIRCDDDLTRMQKQQREELSF